jgi:hypothetical protein
MSALKIHFACLFGVDYETDILPYWLKHYAAMKLDSYKVFLHREAGRISDTLIGTFRNAGFDVECITGVPHSNGLLRMTALENYAASLPKDDFLVTADADEFHMIDYWEALHKYDIVMGYLVDHYSSLGLEACRMDPFRQYPHEEPFTRELLKNFTPPFLRKTAWLVTHRTKVMAARAGEEVFYSGSHSMKVTPFDAVVLADQKVHHFAWREASRRKLAVKSYFTRENLDEIYCGDVPQENADQYDSLKKMDLIGVL